MRGLPAGRPAHLFHGVPCKPFTKSARFCAVSGTRCTVLVVYTPISFAKRCSSDSVVLPSHTPRTNLTSARPCLMPSRGCHVHHHKGCGPCLITRLMSPLGVLEKITEVPSQTPQLSRSPLVAANAVSHDLSPLRWSLQVRFLRDLSHYAPRRPRSIRRKCVTSWRARSSAEGSSGARGTRSSPCPPASASSPARSSSHDLVAFLELSSCLCMDESRPHQSLRDPHVRQAPSTGFACLQRCCPSRVLPRREVVPTVSSSARMLQGRELLARAACLESLLASVPLQLPVWVSTVQPGAERHIRWILAVKISV